MLNLKEAIKCSIEDYHWYDRPYLFMFLLRFMESKEEISSILSEIPDLDETWEKNAHAIVEKYLSGQFSNEHTEYNEQALRDFIAERVEDIQYVFTQFAKIPEFMREAVLDDVASSVNRHTASINAALMALESDAAVDYNKVGDEGFIENFSNLSVKFLERVKDEIGLDMSFFYKLFEVKTNEEGETVLHFVYEQTEQDLADLLSHISQSVELSS